MREESGSTIYVHQYSEKMKCLTPRNACGCVRHISR